MSPERRVLVTRVGADEMLLTAVRFQTTDCGVLEVWGSDTSPGAGLGSTERIATFAPDQWRHCQFVDDDYVPISPSPTSAE